MRFIIVTAMFIFTGCGDAGVGSLHGDYLVVSDCRNGMDVEFAPYEMDGDFFALQTLGNIAFIRMQPGGQLLHRSDALVIQVSDPHFVQSRLNEKIFFDNPKVRATLHILGSCPDSAQSMTAYDGPGEGGWGHIIFTHFGVKKGDRIEASLVFDLRDDRTGELVGLGFKGTFDFTVRVGKPYQPFSDKI